MRRNLRCFTIVLSLLAPIIPLHPQANTAAPKETAQKQGGEGPPANAVAGSPDVAFVDVTLIDVVAGVEKPGMTVVVSRNRIVRVGPAKEISLPDSTKRIQASGKFLIPGLWNMHVHLGNATEAALPALVASGVTTVRDMGSPDYGTLKRWSIEALTGQRIGPRIFAAGPIVDSGVPDANRYIVNNPEEGRRAVDDLARQGVDFIKVHEHLSRETYFAIAYEARLLGIPFAGHVPVGPNGFAVSAIEASNAGQKSLEHFYGIPFAPDDPTVPEMLAAFRRNGTWVCPTLIVFWNRAHFKELNAGRASIVKQVAPSLVSFWDGQLKEFSPDEKVPNILLSVRTAEIKILATAHIPLLAGTDLGFAYVLPSDLSKELELMVDAGLTPMEALRTATINPAIFMNRDSEMGSINEAKIADLVLLDDDPIQNIHAIEHVDGVMANGKFMTHAELAEAFATF